MTQRLQVLFEEDELEEIRQLAKRHRMTTAEWVRQTLREARRQQPLRTAERKLRAIDRASEHSFPAPEIAQMLQEIEAGYGSESGS